ncbi:MAG: DUF6788 family protein [Candidatus Ozemobacteraceae bacterium]
MKKSTEILRKRIVAIKFSPNVWNRIIALLWPNSRTSGLVHRGHIKLRLNRCGNPTWCCKADPPMLHCPYYKCPCKVPGKTVNATLTPEQATCFIGWVQNMNNLVRIVHLLQDIWFKRSHTTALTIFPEAISPTVSNGTTNRVLYTHGDTAMRWRRISPEVFVR